MIRFEDLMAARFLYQQLPERRDVLLAGLESLHHGGQRSLLASLVDHEVITLDQGHYVHGMVEAHKRERALGIYAHLLTGAGVSPQHLQALREVIGAEGDLNALGDAVLARGLVASEREQQLRFQARLVMDRDMANQVRSHLAAHGSPGNVNLSGSTMGGQISFSSSTVIKGMATQPQVPPEDEVSKLVRGTLSDADSELPGPKFRIPNWIDMSDPRTGKKLKEYRILGKIGAGNMGSVYLADRQDDPEKPIALKLLAKDAPDDAKGRFKREILANSFFSHPGALDVYDAGTTERGYHYLAMEFFDGDDLEKILDEAKKLPPRKALELAQQVFATLGASHQAGVVHRDVKPGNILISRDYQSAKLMDFGIAIIRDLDEFKAKVFHSMEGSITGTPEYMSPEQAAGEAITASSDLYSMGVVLYHMLSGQLPFESETSGGYMTCHILEDPKPITKADSSLKALPKEALGLIASLLGKNPDQRPASAEEVVATIDDALPNVKDTGGTSRFLSFLGWGK